MDLSLKSGFFQNLISGINLIVPLRKKRQKKNCTKWKYGKIDRKRNQLKFLNDPKFQQVQYIYYIMMAG
jgi:hypothetical protein